MSKDGACPKFCVNTAGRCKAAQEFIAGVAAKPPPLVNNINRKRKECQGRRREPLFILPLTHRQFSVNRVFCLQNRWPYWRGSYSNPGAAQSAFSECLSLPDTASFSKLSSVGKTALALVTFRSRRLNPSRALAV